MIKELRKKFIRIAMISITLVMVIFCATVNVANYLSVESELTQMLDMICQNQGNLPPAPPGGFSGGSPTGPLTWRPFTPPGISSSATPTAETWSRRT